jgi:preprotein translocase subunit SecG
MILTILQIAIAIILIVLVLLQERSAGMSGIFGGDGGGFYQTRRGLERIVFWATIVFAIAFAAVSIAQLVAH